jgi:hypothetical protein
MESLNKAFKQFDTGNAERMARFDALIVAAGQAELSDADAAELVTVSRLIGLRRGTVMMSVARARSGQAQLGKPTPHGFNVPANCTSYVYDNESRVVAVN